MKLNVTLTLFATLFLLVPQSFAAETDWALKGDWSESCCCQAACPCVFGSAPTKGHCDGSALFEIDKGHYGDVKVDGIKAVVTYRIGEWLRVYIEEKATEAQVDAVAKVLNQETTFGFLFVGEGETRVLSVEKAPITVEKTDSKIAFSVPDSKVELEVMNGPNGKVIRIENLAIPWFVNGYEQYVAKTTSHERDGTEFSYEGTNGATSYVDAVGSIAADE